MLKIQPIFNLNNEQMTLQQLMDIHDNTHAALSPWKIQRVRAALGRVRPYERGNMDLKDAIEVVYTCLATPATDYPSIVLAVTDAKFISILDSDISPALLIKEIIESNCSDNLLHLLVFRPTGGVMFAAKNDLFVCVGNIKDAVEAVLWPTECIQKIAKHFIPNNDEKNKNAINGNMICMPKEKFDKIENQVKEMSKLMDKYLERQFLLKNK